MKKYMITCLCLILLCVAILSGCTKNTTNSTISEEISFDEQIVTPTWEQTYFPREKENGDLRIWQISDLHYFSRRLTDGGEKYQTLLANMAGMDIDHTEELLEAFYKLLKEELPDDLILSGDVTFNGELLSHQELSAWLATVEDLGVSVFVIPGNHDINSPYARKIFDTGVEGVDNITEDVFAEIYAAYGFDEAISRDANSLSYVADLGEDTWVIMLDTSIYRDGNVKAGGNLSFESKQWILEQLQVAKENNKRVFTVSHHNLLPHNDVFTADYVVMNSGRLVEEMAQEGVRLNLSGHMHNMNIAQNKAFFDVALESVSVWPHLYGQLDIRRDGRMSYTANRIPMQSETYQYLYRSGLKSFDRGIEEYGIAKEDIPIMKEFLVSTHTDYFVGKLRDTEEYEQSMGYALWKKYAAEELETMYIDSMITTARKDHTFISEEEFE